MPPDCDAIISTAVQEGFGYLYLNALHWRKPLLARYLDVLDGILDLFGEYPRRFWADFRVPSNQSLTQRTQEAYLKKINASGNSVPEKVRKSMRTAVGKIAMGGGIDMSYLSVDDQLAMLEEAKGTDWLDEARLLNRELLDSIARTLMAAAPDMGRNLNARFGDAVFARTFAGILASFGEKTPSPSPKKIREAVGKAFGRIDYFRLLYDYKKPADLRAV